MMTGRNSVKSSKIQSRERECERQAGLVVFDVAQN